MTSQTPAAIREKLLSSKDANLIALGHNLTDDQIRVLIKAFNEVEKERAA